MVYSLWKILQTYSGTCIFCAKQYTDFQKQSVGGAKSLELAKSLKTVFDEVHFPVNLLHQNPIKKYDDELEK